MTVPPEHDRETWPPAPAVGAAPPAASPESSWWGRLAAAPPELALFAAFSLLDSLGELWLTFVGPKAWREATYPYTGGHLIYLNCLFFCAVLIFTPHRGAKYRAGIMVVLLLNSGFWAYEYLTRSAVNFHNPYLTVSPWRPLWTVALPLAWALALGLAPALRRRA